ncbi:hypothetical protein ABT215_00585 [Streptomyces sp900105755]|uniref:hypothetical protein n=1 Tax=Streptomyces sp. 900105755 TaxID=3154389 RepID=UPI0033295C27
MTIPVERALNMLSKTDIDVDPSTRQPDLDGNLIATRASTPTQIKEFAKNAGAGGGSGGGAAGFVTVGGALEGSLFGGAVALSADDVAKAPPAQRVRTAARDAAGLAGAAYGAEVGAAIGSPCPERVPSWAASSAAVWRPTRPTKSGVGSDPGGEASSA